MPSCRCTEDKSILYVSAVEVEVEAIFNSTNVGPSYCIVSIESGSTTGITIGSSQNATQLACKPPPPREQ